VEKWGYKIFFSLALLANPVLYPHLKIRGAAHGYGSEMKGQMDRQAGTNPYHGLLEGWLRNNPQPWRTSAIIPASLLRFLAT